MTVVALIAICTTLMCGVLAFMYRYRCTKNTGDQAKSRETIRHLNIINELSSSLLSSLELDYIIDVLLDRSKELLRATRSAFVLLGSDGNILNFYSSMGPTSGCKPVLTGILEKVARDHIPLRAHDIRTLQGYRGFPNHHPDIKGIIVVPVLLRGEIVGELIVTDKIDNKAFTSEDEDLLLTIAFYFALALEKVQLHDEIKKLATTDGLTGLQNHRSFQERMQEEVERSGRTGRPFSLLIIDIDRFKLFNDNYGHRVGDDLLKLIAEVFLSNTRGIDMVARYGGEEFAIILTETGMHGACETAERIRREVEKTGVKNNGESKSVTVSIGASSFPEDGRSSDEIIEAADKALYLSKRSGRNKVFTFSERI